MDPLKKLGSEQEGEQILHDCFGYVGFLLAEVAQGFLTHVAMAYNRPQSFNIQHLSTCTESQAEASIFPSQCGVLPWGSGVWEQVEIEQLQQGSFPTIADALGCHAVTAGAVAAILWPSVCGSSTAQAASCSSRSR